MDTPGPAERARRERVLARFAVHAMRDPRPSRMLRRAVSQARRALRADAAELLAIGERGVLRVALSGSRAMHALIDGASTGPVEAEHALLSLEQGPQRFGELRQDTLSEPWQTLGMKSALCVPIRAREHGDYVLCVFGSRGQQFAEHDCATLESFALVLAAALASPRDTAPKLAASNDYRSVAVLLEAFAAVLAHEVRNPLNALAMNAEVIGMLMQRGRTDQVQPVLDRIARDVQRCGVAIKELSTVAARDGGSQAMLVGDLLRAVCERLKLLGYVPEPRLEIDVDPPELLLIGNQAVLEFALVQVARALLLPGVHGLKMGARADQGRLIVTMDRHGDVDAGEARMRVIAPMPPTRAAALALARHALAGMGATVAPDDLENTPERCAVAFPQPQGAAP